MLANIIRQICLEVPKIGSVSFSNGHLVYELTINVFYVVLRSNMMMKAVPSEIVTVVKSSHLRGKLNLKKVDYVAIRSEF